MPEIHLVIYSSKELAKITMNMKNKRSAEMAGDYSNKPLLRLNQEG